ncbi:alpha/beta hydrolase [Actinokineospora auranticolor]|uniref:Pimeloyl-ACP methyl ester carboxylesterase n=1 Tax=Actinokineospora auranticolor TaxID=155976 RepID=A0A2S6GHI8_9PSEU|nr:alpha/beta hydrolase [Actinokineospora auranticolor]PPK64694.1 pimeloyl-ACP methyl ester carboxylesterase [Actinokineospora auranticolor]
MKVGRGVALLPLVLLAACTAGPSNRPGIVVNDGDTGGGAGTPSSTGPAPLPPLTEPKAASINWTPCPPEAIPGLTPTPDVPLSCGRVNGVLDSPYAPGRGTVRMAVLRAGSGPIPVLVLNDVDGLPGSRYAARLARTLPKELLTRFSLIGLDRRGTGRSDPVSCVPEEVRAAIVDADPRALDVEGLVDQARTAGQQCSITLETRLPSLDTWRTAGDAESVRAALGVDKLHAIGHGEGSRVLTVYAERFPDRVGRMVLDGLPDPNQDAVVALEGVAEASDKAFGAFADDCAQRGCELGSQARQALTDVLNRAASDPLVSSDEELELSPGVVLRAVQVGLSDRASWPALSAALAAARGGSPDGLVALVSPAVLGKERVPAVFDAGLVTRCNDTKSRLSTQAMTGASADWNRRFPLFGALTAEWLAVCSPWPVPSRPVAAPSASGAPPMVVLGTSVDPVTPLSGTERAAQQLATASLVTWQGAGHGALGFSTCATEAASGFLVEGKVPRDGTVCPP